jgi:hypothetical protein
MKNQSSASIWAASSTARVAVLEPNAGFYPGTGTLGRGRAARRGGESLMKLALVVANSAIWAYVAMLPIGLVA